MAEEGTAACESSGALRSPPMLPIYYQVDAGIVTRGPIYVYIYIYIYIYMCQDAKFASSLYGSIYFVIVDLPGKYIANHS